MTRLTLTRDEVLEASHLWWLMVILGLASVAAGVVLVTRPSHSLNTLAVVLGIFLLIDGIFELITAFMREAHQAMAAIVGVLGIIVGILLIRHPSHAVNAVGLLIGLWLVSAGCIRLFRALIEGVQPLLRAVIAVIEICAGVVIVAEPHIGYSTLAIIAGIWLILNGVGVVVFGVALRAAAAEPRPSAPGVHPPAVPT